MAAVPFPRFGRARRCRTVAALIPYAGRHLVLRPFRCGPEYDSVRRLLAPNAEFRRVTHDVYCDMLIRGYTQVTGRPVEPGTGLALVLFAVFIYTFDVEFERGRMAGHPGDFRTVLSSAPVGAVWTAFERHLRAHRHGESVRAFILSRFDDHYDDYRRRAVEAAAHPTYAATTELARYDSGLSLRTMYDIIRLCNDHPGHEGCAEQFFAVGMAGKYVDDLADVRADDAVGNPNLLRALVSRIPAEAARLESALESGVTPTPAWWREQCPATYEAYLDDTFAHYARITDAALRLPVDVYLTILHSRRFWRTERRRSPASAA